jgi:hypothetical protein
MRYTVFLGAPPPSTTSTLSDDKVSFQWRTVASTTEAVSKDRSTEIYSSSGLDATYRHISAMYENIIFGEEDEDEGDTDTADEELKRDTRGGRTHSSCMIRASRCG